MNIWMKLPGHKPEKIDTCTKKEAGYILGEYRLVYRSTPGAIVWAGTRDDYRVLSDNRKG
jgi:hypothetical protein